MTDEGVCISFAIWRTKEGPSQGSVLKTIQKKKTIWKTKDMPRIFNNILALTEYQVLQIVSPNLAWLISIKLVS